MGRSHLVAHWTLVVMLSAALAATAAEAQLLSGTDSTQACAENDCVPMTNTETSVTNGLLIPNQTSSISYVNTSGGVANPEDAAASGNGYISYGHIDGFVYSKASISFSIYPPGNGSGLGDDGTSASGNFFGDWKDTLTVRSATLPVGTPVQLSFTDSVAAATLNATGPNPGTQASLNSVFFAGQNSLNLSATVAQEELGFTQTKTMVISTAIGQQISIEGYLDVIANAEPFNERPGTAYVDPPTASFYINSLTPGASYTTASGMNYRIHDDSTGDRSRHRAWCTHFIAR